MGKVARMHPMMLFGSSPFQVQWHWCSVLERKADHNVDVIETDLTSSKMQVVIVA